MFNQASHWYFLGNMFKMNGPTFERMVMGVLEILTNVLLDNYMKIERASAVCIIS